MYWKDKYDKAKWDNKQLIGDKVMRNTFFKQNPTGIFVEEARFKEFQADILEFEELENAWKLFGYEIKSDRDSLDRLEEQLRGYLKYCNFVFVYATLRHKKELLKILSNPEFKMVGVMFYRMNCWNKSFELCQKATYQDLSNKGLSTVSISKKNKLYRWIYLLKEIWGEEIQTMAKENKKCVYITGDNLELLSKYSSKYNKKSLSYWLNKILDEFRRTKRFINKDKKGYTTVKISCKDELVELLEKLGENYDKEAVIQLINTRLLEEFSQQVREKLRKFPDRLYSGDNHIDRMAEKCKKFLG